VSAPSYPQSSALSKTLDYKRGGKNDCIVRESNPGRVELAPVSGNDPGYHYPNNALIDLEIHPLSRFTVQSETSAPLARV
jgi:hypothetical protein